MLVPPYVNIHTYVLTVCMYAEYARELSTSGYMDVDADVDVDEDKNKDKDGSRRSTPFVYIHIEALGTIYPDFQYCVVLRGITQVSYNVVKFIKITYKAGPTYYSISRDKTYRRYFRGNIR